jgi:8-oxo-dGTP diphosphatase
MSQDRFDYASLPKRRIGAGALFVNGDGRPLLVELTYKPTWEIPGGGVEGGEDPRSRAAREVWEEPGLVVAPGRLLVIDHQTDPPPRGDSMMLIYYEGGVLARPEATRLNEPELRSFRFASENELDLLLNERLVYRIRQAMRASREGTVVEIVNGRTVQ